MKTRGLALCLALCLLLLSGCQPTMTGAELKDALADAFGWDWLTDPVGAAMDVGLLAGADARARRVPTERVEPVLAEIERRKGEKLAWLHGFYAFSSYGQISLADRMEAVTLGWSRMCCGPESGPYVSTTWEDNNEWFRPSGGDGVIEELTAKGVRYHLGCFTSTRDRLTLPDGAETSVLEHIISPENRKSAARALAEAAAEYQGVTVDFEGLGSAGDRDHFSAFMALLRDALRPEQTLYVAVPPDTWYHGYDYRAMGELCDRVILMAHDYQWVNLDGTEVGTARTNIPPAPLDQVYQALKSVTDPVTGVADREKIALAVSFSSAGVEVHESEDLLAGVQMYAPGPETLWRRLNQPDAQPGWWERGQTPYVFYHDEEGRRYKVWYEDERSVAAKMRLARLFGISGLSLWRLGTVPDFEGYDVWSAILEEAGR